MRIGIDIDDTIAYTYEQVRDALLKEKNYVISDKDIYYNDPEVIGYYYKNSEIASSVLKPKEYAAEIINKLKDEGYMIYFLTSRRKDLYKITYKWLVDNGFKFDELYIECKKKDSVCEELKINYFIDDSLDHVNSVKNKNINSYLFTSNYNIKFDVDNRVNNWKEIYKLIKESE